MGCSASQQPSLAELARTTLARADVATLLSRSRASGAGATALVRVRDSPDGRPVVELEPESPMVRRLAACPVATVSVPAPAPFRTLQLTGPAVACEATCVGRRAYRLSLLSTRLVAVSSHPVPVGEFQAAAPDPLWPYASQTIAHLEDAHSTELLACTRAHGLRDVEAVIPRTMDRYGLELALLGATGVRVVRLPFPGGPVKSLEQVGNGLRAVLTCRCGAAPVTD